MNVVCSNAVEYHKELQSQYVSKLHQNGVSSPEQYFSRIGAFDNGLIKERTDVRDLLNSEEFPLEIFYRVAPTNNQDVMIATLNPGMQDNITCDTFCERSDGSRGEYRRQADAGDSIEMKATTVATNLEGFLTHSQNRFKDLIEIMRNNLDLMDNSSDYEEYVSCQSDTVMDGFFGDVCYTWMYKLATPSISELNENGGPDGSWARQKFAKEIFEIVDPKVLVSVGKHGWTTVWEYLDRNYSENPKELIDAYSSESPVVKSYNSTFGVGAYAGLYHVEVEDLWILTTWHASHWIKSDRLRNNTQLLNSKLEP